eukprot:TRINITY_DN1767_c0_g1_i1.p1 TRINITY_DN1767_c0_g1~~TRINITY_DN1767_c0_g1_i1.p1  ORF type:complete len:345 (-),score=84.55 TRINITY_DN1767_c0_g1_i1:26-1039(-)
MSGLVCVTGATGYLGAHVVRVLLEAGYRVRGTVRDPNKAEMLKPLRALPGADERLEFFRADLLEEGSFDAAVSGCDYVIHVASPYINGVTAAQAQARLIDPAVKGTRNVLNAVVKAKCVKRVVLTSSIAAVQDSPDDKGVGHEFTEEDWNTTSTIESSPYRLSKVLAEKEAWAMAKEHSLDLVCINPGGVLGPTINGRTDAESIQIMDIFFNGKLKFGTPHLEFAWVDVRDTAVAHLEAMRNPAASGRYLCVAKCASLLEIGNILRPKYGAYPLPPREIPNWLTFFVAHNVFSSAGLPLRVNNTKITSQLGIKWTPLEKTCEDAAENLFELGVARRR